MLPPASSDFFVYEQKNRGKNPSALFVKRLVEQLIARLVLTCYLTCHAIDWLFDRSND